MSAPFRLRPAVPGDARLIWEWLQDPAVRASAFSPEPISWPTHERWFAERLKRQDEPYWVAEEASGRVLGQLRFEKGEEGWTVSIVVAPDQRGKGVGRALLKDGCAALRALHKGVSIAAFVRKDNPGSLRAFESAGFVPSASRTVRGVEAHLLKLP